MKKSYPSEGQEFKLSFDGDLPANQPLTMFDVGGVACEHNGPRVRGRQTARFKLIGVHCSDWVDLTRQLASYGKPPSGQWLKAFINTFPDHDGQGEVGVADKSWSCPSLGQLGAECFPCIRQNGELALNIPARSLPGRWLVMMRG